MTHYFNYIVTNSRRSRFYIGTTADLWESLHRHKVRPVQGVSHAFFLDHLVWYEEQDWFLEAIRKEKEIKSMDRSALVGFIESKNPFWEDLSPGFVSLKLNDFLKQIHLN
ncbi:GIY-YIG nuclease family protein [Balneola sp. MJW-20]|uniref:GIY-YIG nuclease family protein n=1 Tax=Gracilimonas aurantiaca TaxID=3234185 RepID=UPI003467CC98